LRAKYALKMVKKSADLILFGEKCAKKVRKIKNPIVTTIDNFHVAG
jgi:hypothetical protein